VFVSPNVGGRVEWRCTSSDRPTRSRKYMYDYTSNQYSGSLATTTNSFGSRAAEYSGTRHGVYAGMYLKTFPSCLMMTSSSTYSPGIRDESSSPVYS
jgi:hypothetical protein